MASWEVVSPLLPSSIDQAKPKVRKHMHRFNIIIIFQALGVFWDIENCNVPNGKVTHSL